MRRLICKCGAAQGLRKDRGGTGEDNTSCKDSRVPRREDVGGDQEGDVLPGEDGCRF